MKKELQDQLYKKYPKLFGQKDLPMNQTCMCWGIETGDGWYKVIDDACKEIQELINSGKAEQVSFVQVKEKFGSLRIYTSFYLKQIENIIETACQLSEKTCEMCGSTEEVSQTEGWISTLCKNCMEKR